MRRTLAYKKHGAGALYIIITTIGVISMLIGVATDDIKFVIMGFVAAILCGILSIQYLTIPPEIIVLCEDGTLILKKGVRIKLEDLVDVSYRRASARGIQYRWGSVTLTTKIKKFKFGFVANCEDVAKNLTRLMYEAKNNG
jgi:hypothetical protein